MIDELEWLEDWFAQQVDGRWEHEFGINIQSLDNPGWDVTINLQQTGLEAYATDTVLLRAGDPPTAANGNLGGGSWIVCELREGIFSGSGDSKRLRQILRCFREWVTDSSVTAR